VSYPENLASDVVLRDGSTVSLRPVRPEDAPILLDLFRSLDERSLAFRFFTGAPNLEDAAQILADVDYKRRFGLLALRGGERHPVGHGFFAAIDDELVEIAFAVSPSLQGQGLGSVLLAQLAERATEDGFTRMVADVLPENHPMISMFRSSGLPVEVRAEPGSVVVEMPTSPSPEAIALFQERDAVAARAAVAAFFDPRTVMAIDGPPDSILPWARGAAEAIRAMVVRGEPDAWEARGAAAERELLAICRHAGTRLVGPASFGVLDNRPGRTLNLTGATERPPHGGVGIVAQAADAGRELLEGAVRQGVGVSTFVSLGARADITVNDLLEYWEDDRATQVALLQVESFSDPRRFARIARRIAARLPLVVVADRAAAEPPGRDLFDQVGAIRAGGVGEALELAANLADAAARDGIHRQSAAPPPRAAPRSDEAAAILARALARDAEELDPEDAVRLLGCYGIAVEGAPADGASSMPLRIVVATDPLFGPVLRCGPPRTPEAELPVRLCPLAEGDVAALLGGHPAAGVASPDRRASLERALTGAAAAAAAHDEIAGLVLDPVLATRTGIITEARVRVRRPPARRPWPRTWE
jgi:ribosomal protein S18 acetylase RimI-like enzyme